ncbi:MAG TPA: hypothetical protein VNF24_02770 [Candidatus Acidoferrales bacterium]|nr:hypothetical protein [Candidatus Acidoferrales bacterium]
MPHGSDPRRRPDQQSPDSGASVPPPWWSALSDSRLPAEGPRVRQRASWRDRLQRIGIRITAPLVILAVAGAVVAAGFGYQIVSWIIGAVMVGTLGVVSVIHHRRAVAVGDASWWR